METLLSAVLGDLISRSMSFVMDRYYRQQKGVEENIQRLRGLLLRIEITVEEAERRHITNQAMLRQLQMMRNGVYKGSYTLDTFMCQVIQDRAQDEVSEHSFALSQFNPAKRFCFSARTRNRASEGEKMKELQKMLGSLECIVADMKEFIVFLRCYPPMWRQPYSKYLWLEKCMFGRQAEQERIINFLLEAEPPGVENVGVLPIVGRTRVGKSTLIEHVRCDERVRKCFSLIIFLSESDIKDENLVSLRGSGVIKHQNLASTGKSLVIIELVGDVDKGTWRKVLYSLRRDHIAPVSKIIVTSRSKRIADFGTTQILELNYLPQEAYWYFFKVIAFGSTNPEEHPDLASMGMEIAAEMNGSFLGANMVGGLLRGNLSVQFWYKVLRCLKDHTSKHLLLFGEHPNDLMAKGRPVYIWRMTKTQCVFLAHSYYQACSAQQDLPRITVQDVHTGSVKPPQGKFEALAWRSSIPPYYSYSASCVVQTPSPHKLAKKKRSRQQRRVNLI